MALLEHHLKKYKLVTSSLKLHYNKTFHTLNKLKYDLNYSICNK